ncbi:hypothetical protein GUJ93_ZPchr0004g38481 [Zizania palustris]|uniref:Uncharacterized protein n=1 Tax=Zizania palustris TaxID=103762 RepID=A0A8J5VFZ7_ZIZPA|nr:hypothetical protein GUJ93_ZPchr0004g38481 [Zizania palustris]
METGEKVSRFRGPLKWGLEDGFVMAIGKGSVKLTVKRRRWSGSRSLGPLWSPLEPSIWDASGLLWSRASGTPLIPFRALQSLSGALSENRFRVHPGAPFGVPFEVLFGGHFGVYFRVLFEAPLASSG